MSKYIHTKQFICRGLVQNINERTMVPCKFNVTVSNDNHCTVSFIPEKGQNIPIQYSVDFTKVLRALEGN